jgi:hypothetical protein
MTRTNLIFVSFNITEANYFNFLTPRLASNFFRKSILFCLHISTVNIVLHFAKVTNNHLGLQNNVVGENSNYLGYCAVSNCKYKRFEVASWLHIQDKSQKTRNNHEHTVRTSHLTVQNVFHRQPHTHSCVKVAFDAWSWEDTKCYWI